MNWDYAAHRIGGHVDGEQPTSAKYDPFWAKAEELDVPVFMHPNNALNVVREGALAGRADLGNIIGNPLETTVFLSHMIFDGVFEPLSRPESLRGSRRRIHSVIRRPNRGRLRQEAQCRMCQPEKPERVSERSDFCRLYRVCRRRPTSSRCRSRSESGGLRIGPTPITGRTRSA